MELPPFCKKTVTIRGHDLQSLPGVGGAHVVILPEGRRHLALAQPNQCLDPGPPAPEPPPFGGTAYLDPDIITPTDPTAFVELSYQGQDIRAMNDRRVEGWITVSALLFRAVFDDGSVIELQLNPEFGTVGASRETAEYYASAIGRLPAALRKDVRFVFVHRGEAPFGGGNHGLLIHTGNVDRNDLNGSLEEVLAHEGAHTSLDPAHASSPGWLAAQKADRTFISTYARDHPTREDVAESLVAWLGLRHRPGRLDASLQSTILKTIPNRIRYFDGLGLQMHPMQ